MRYEEFRRQLGKAGLTNIMFAELVRINPNSLTNYGKQGSVPSHWAIVATLMGIIADNKLDFKEALMAIEVESKKIRGNAGVGRFGGEKQFDLLIDNGALDE